MSELLGMNHADGICCDFFFPPKFLFASTVALLGMLFYLILIILFGKYSHFIETAETLMLNNV